MDLQRRTVSHLNDFPSDIQALVVRNDLHMQTIVLDKSFHSLQLHPEVVRVEDAELLHRLELVYMFARYLPELQQAQMLLVLNQRTALHGFIG